MSARLPAHLEVAAIRRVAESMGGNAMVLAKGDHDAGAIMIVVLCRGNDPQLWERVPNRAGNRIFVQTSLQTTDSQQEIQRQIERARHFDADLWILEVDVPNRERFVASLPV